jgi:hypothetical protein
LGALLLAGFIIGAVLALVLVMLVFLSAVQYLLLPAGAAPAAELQLGLWLALFGLLVGALVYAVFAVVRWALFVQAVVLEHAGPAAGLRRSAELVRRHWWRTAALLALLTLGQSLVSSLASSLLAGPLAWLAGANLGGLAGGLGFALAGMLYFPLAANALTVLYLRLRERERQAAG